MLHAAGIDLRLHIIRKDFGTLTANKGSATSGSLSASRGRAGRVYRGDTNHLRVRLFCYCRSSLFSRKTRSEPQKASDACTACKYIPAAHCGCGNTCKII